MLLYEGWFVNSDLRLAVWRPQMYISSDTLRGTVLLYAEDDNVKQAVMSWLETLGFLHIETKAFAP